MATRTHDTKSPRTFRATSRARWRAWLLKHHTDVESVLLVYARKNSGERSVSYEESVEEALCFGWIDGVRGRLDETHFTVRFSPRKPSSIWSKLNVERVERLLAEGLMQPSGIETYEVGKRLGRVDAAYAVSDRVDVPTELHEALLGSARGRVAFEALPPGQRNAWARWVGASRRAATRKERARQSLLLVLAGRKAGETDAQAARRGVPSKARILDRDAKPNR
jgi:uncharacterized protein YdeI (YjbR/CyaY-like superfamily)